MERRKWLSNLFKGKSKSQKMTLAETFSGYTPKFTSFGNNPYLSDLVIESIRLKADFNSKLDPKHIKSKDGVQKIETNSSVARILKRPNPYMTMSDFLYKATYLREVNFNVFIYADYTLVNGMKNFTGLYILQPREWTYYEDDASGELFIGFRFNNRSDEVIFNYNEIIHWRKNFESDDYDGGDNGSKNKSLDLLNTLQAYHQICESIAEASKCSCFFDGILKVNAFTQTPDKIKKVRDDFVNDLRANKGIAVLDNGAEWQSITRSLKIVDATTLNHFEERILMHTGVSKAMLLGDFTTAQKEAFYERCIESGLISLGQAMSKVLFTSQQANIGNEIIIYPRKIQLMSTTEVISIISTTIPAGVFKIDEYREMLGYAPLENGEGEQRPRGYNSLDGNTNVNEVTKEGDDNEQ